MPSTATTRVRLEKQASGENSNTWGTRLNSNLIDMTDEAFGVSAFTVSTSKTLTATDYTSDESRPLTLNVTGGTGGTLTIPNVGRSQLVRNASSGALTVTTGSGTTATVAAGTTQWITSTGSNVVYATDWLSSSLVSAFALTVLDDANAGAARTTLGAAASGTNTDITTATGLTSLNSAVEVNESGTITATTLGFRALPSNPKTANYTLALTDNAKCIPNTTGGWTIPANGATAFPVGTIIHLYNDSGSTQDVTITTDTLTWIGVGSTGTRTVPAYGWATLWKKASTVWLIDGKGMT